MIQKILIIMFIYIYVYNKHTTYIYTHTLYIYIYIIYIYMKGKRERGRERGIRYIDRAHICGEMLTTEETERRRDGDGSSLCYISNFSVTLRYLK